MLPSRLRELPSSSWLAHLGTKLVGTDLGLERCGFKHMLKLRHWLSAVIICCSWLLKVVIRFEFLTDHQNAEIRHRTILKHEVILRMMRLQWLGHIHRMDSNRIPKQALTWFSENGKRKCRRSRKYWCDTLSEDRQNIEITWEDFEEVADDRSLWKATAQCDPALGRTKV